MNRLSALVFLLCSSPLIAQVPDWDVGAKLSSAGVGVELGRNFTESQAVRLLYQGLKLGFSARGPNENGMLGDELEYDGRVRLSNVLLVYDWYPLRGYLRLSGGLLINDSNATVTTRCTELLTGCEFGNSTYQPLVVGDVKGDVDFKRYAPYIGFGWRGAFGEIDNLMWTLDFGAAWFGDINVELTPGGICAQVPGCLDDVEEEERRVERDLDDLPFYPVVGVGMVYQFGGE